MKIQKKLSKINPDLIFLIPKGDLDIFKKRKITNVKEFMWWEDIKIDEFTRVLPKTAVFMLKRCRPRAISRIFCVRIWCSLQIRCMIAND